MTNRRQFIAGSAALAVASPAIAQARTPLDVYIDADTNIQDFWRNTVKPAFDKSVSGHTMNITITKGVASGNRTIAERAFAALQTKSDPRVDYFEDHDTRLPVGSLEAGLWSTFDASNVPNYGRINKLASDLPSRIAYRGSQVLIAYDSTKVGEKDVPKTFAALMEWAKKNPGRFTYGRPDRGGSGQFFVVRALHEGNGRDPGLFTAANFEANLAEERLKNAWTLLRELHPHTYGGGAYPAGNTPTLQLLAQGVVDMISVWSDQALQAINLGVLPKTIKLVQLTDLALCGGFAYSSSPANGKNREGAFLLANLLLTKEIQTAVVREIGGFPGVDWSHLDPDLRKEYLDLIPLSIPTFPSGPWRTALNAGWYKNVATNITP